MQFAHRQPSGQCRRLRLRRCARSQMLTTIGRDSQQPNEAHCFTNRVPRGEATVILYGRRLLTRTVESYRQGYPRLSAFMHSDREFILFRRFGYLHVRVLLHKQDAIIELEHRLQRLDDSESNAFFLSSRRQDGNLDRQSLIAELESRLLEYGVDIRWSSSHEG